MAIIQQQNQSNPSQQQQTQNQTNVNNRVYQPKGTGFVNLQSLLNNANANRLGGALGQGVSSNVNQTAGNIQQGEQAFQSGANQEQQRLSGLQNQAQGVLNKVQNSPTDINPNDIASYKSFANTQYSGPSQIQNQQNLQNQQALSQQNANLLRNQGGQQELLRSYINQPGYTNANQNLDSLLLGNQGIQQNLQQVRQQALQKLSSNDVNNLINLNQQNVQQAQQALQGKQQATGQQANTLATNEQADLQNRLSALQAKDTAAQNLYNQLLQGNYSGLSAQDVGGNVTPEQLRVLNAYKQGGMDISPFVKSTQAQNLNLSGIANAGDQAKLNALAQLTGQNNLSGLLNGTLGGAQAGTTSIAGNTVQQAQEAANKVAPTFTASGNTLGNVTINNPLATAIQNVLAAGGSGTQSQFSTALDKSNNINNLKQQAGALQQYMSNPSTANLSQASQFMNSIVSALQQNPSAIRPDILNYYQQQANSLNQQVQNALNKYGVSSFTPTENSNPLGIGTK